jgi:predicted sulfurtransferase
MKQMFATLLLLAAAASVAARAQQKSPPLTLEQQQQISTLPAMSEDKRVKTESIDSVMSKGDVILLDVREPKEIEELGGYEGAINIPVTGLEKRIGELPKDKTILTT